MTGTEDRSPPAGSRDRALVKVWRRSRQKLKTYMLITIAIMC